MKLRLTRDHSPSQMRAPCLGFEGYYDVSDQGTVRRIAKLNRPGQTEPRPLEVPQILRGTSLASGHVEYTLSMHGQSHKRLGNRLVAEAFLGPRKKGQEVRHKNGRKDDDRASNLEWVSRSEAALHRTRELGVGRGSQHGRAKLNDAKVREIRARLDAGESQRQIAAHHGVSHTVIGQIGKRRRWAHVP